MYILYSYFVSILNNRNKFDNKDGILGYEIPQFLCKRLLFTVITLMVTLVKIMFHGFNALTKFGNDTY